MPIKLKTSLAFAVFIAGTSTAFSNEAHHNSSDNEGAMASDGSQKANMGMMDTGKGMMPGADHHKMMQNMMSMIMAMHGNATQMGNPNLFDNTTMHQMDKDLMHMMGGSMNQMSADENGDGQVSRAEMVDWMKSLHMMGDANENGMISLGEFEMLHGMLMKERMVDRFQHLDADGDGEITQQEMMAKARLLPRHK